VSPTDQTTELGEAEGYAEATVRSIARISWRGAFNGLCLTNSAISAHGGSITPETATKGDTDILGGRGGSLSATEWEYDLTDGCPPLTHSFLSLA
jgi:hypothetical protein